MRWLIRAWMMWAGVRILRDRAWTGGNPDGELAGIGASRTGLPFGV